jgi:hypothetical protein
MSSLSTIGRLSALVIAVAMLVFLQPRQVSAFELVYEIRATNGTELAGDRLQRLAGVLDPDNSVRVGIELRPDLWLGYSSRDGVTMVLDF